MKEYLGDGVYVELEDDEVLTLTTETNTIHLEPDVLLALMQFVGRTANWVGEV